MVVLAAMTDSIKEELVGTGEPGTDEQAGERRVGVLDLLT